MSWGKELSKVEEQRLVLCIGGPETFESRDECREIPCLASGIFIGKSEQHFRMGKLKSSCLGLLRCDAERLSCLGLLRFGLHTI